MRKKWIACCLAILISSAVPTMAAPIDRTSSWVKPLEGELVILSPYGQVRAGYSHEGIDIAADMGTPIYAAEGGVVTKAAPDSKGVTKGGGHMVFVAHGDGTESRYMHLSEYAVAFGDEVEAGDIIGFTGMSGDTTVPHLHYEYRVGAGHIDPSWIFKSMDDFEPIQEPFLVPQT